MRIVAINVQLRIPVAATAGLLLPFTTVAGLR